MPRKPRLDTRYAIFHVMAKGNDSCTIFREPGDFSKFKYLLDDSRAKDPHILFAYCLMPNHIHLLLETLEIPLSRIMHRLLLRYSLYFNKKYERSGHLFQGRFKAKSCKQENYLLQLLVYIHDNPRKAGLVDGAVSYPYSSERLYERKVATLVPVNNMRALSMIGPSPRAAWKAYHQHLDSTRNADNEQRGSMGVRSQDEPSFHPDEEIYDDPRTIFEMKPIKDEFDFLSNVPLDQICAAVADLFKVSPASLGGNSKQRMFSQARSMLIYLAGKAGWRSVDLTGEFGFHPGTIAYHRNRFEEVCSPGQRKQVLAELRRIIDERAGERRI